MHEGHIRLFRKLRKAPYYKDSQYVHLWVHLLMSVNWTARRIKLRNSDRFIDLKPGQFLTSRVTLAKETGINRSKLERILKAFENEQQIEQQTFNKYRIISISKWADYQCSEQQIEQQMSNKRATDEQQMSTTNKVNKDKKESTPAVLPDWLPVEEWNAYSEMRKKIKKPMTTFAQELRIKDLDRLRQEGHDPAAVLNRSTSNSWTDIYPVKNQTTSQGRNDVSTKTRCIV